MRKQFLFLSLIICLFLTGCQTTGQKQLMLSFGKEGPYAAKFPTIFVPGLGFKGDFWSNSKMFRLMEKYGWTYGGDAKIKNENGKITVDSSNLHPGILYTVTFSDTQLAIIEQGKELALAVEEIKKINHAQKVVLVGHSMGGLAAREYLQSDYYRGDVSAYMSVGTPHQGSDFDLKKPLMRLAPGFLKNAIWKVDESGDAVRDLRTNSIYLNGGNEKNTDSRFRNKDINGNGIIGDEIVGLNNLKKRPLPENLIYFCVIGGGDAVISTKGQSKNSDGIVDIESADLNELPNVNVPALVLISQSDHFGEANDVMIIMQVVRARQYLVKFSEFNKLEYKSGKPVIQEPGEVLKSKS